jgi:hypothetical protein
MPQQFLPVRGVCMFCLLLQDLRLRLFLLLKRNAKLIQFIQIKYFNSNGIQTHPITALAALKVGFFFCSCDFKFVQWSITPPEVVHEGLFESQSEPSLLA